MVSWLIYLPNSPTLSSCKFHRYSEIKCVGVLRELSIDHNDCELISGFKLVICFLLSQRVKSRSLEDVVILNVDMNTLESPSDDLRNLPSDVVGPALRSQWTHAV